VRSRLRIIIAVFFLAGTAFVFVPAIDAVHIVEHYNPQRFPDCAEVIAAKNPWSADLVPDCQKFLAARRHSIQGEIVVVAITIAGLVAIGGIPNRKPA